MLSTQSLREQLDRYSSGAVSAEALEEWLVAESWDMRRWLPIGVQRLVEAIQVMFIQYADAQISEDELKAQLLQRREQLHRSAAVTKQVEELRARLDEVLREAGRATETISGSQAIPVNLVAA